MKVLLQRVSRAEVRVAGRPVGAIGQGLLVLLGVERGDDAEEAVQVGDRIHAMQAGRIVQSGSPVQLYRQPANAFVAGFFGPVNRFLARVSGGKVATPVGVVPAAAVDEGTEVEANVRPEAIRVRQSAYGEGIRARVVHRRDLGPVHVLRLGLADGSTVKVRQSGVIGAGVGDEVEIELDPAHLFVYPARR